jgi:adenine/guanine phosphoribosyltransferase-like PRPP-binding protein
MDAGEDGGELVVAVDEKGFHFGTEFSNSGRAPCATARIVLIT